MASRRRNDRPDADGACARGPARCRYRVASAKRQGQWQEVMLPNIWSLGTFRFRIIDLWRRSLRRRSQKDGWRMTFLSTRMLVILREGVFAVVFAATAVGATDSQTEQWCCWFYPWRIISGLAAIAAMPAISETTNIRQECPGIKSELRPRNKAAQTRIVSKARIRLDSRKSLRRFKGIICDDISGFESPLQPRSLVSGAITR